MDRAIARRHFIYPMHAASPRGMIFTALFVVLLAVIAFALHSPFSPRRALIAAAIGAGVGLASAYFNVYPGSIRGALSLLAIALILSGIHLRGRFAAEPRPPLVPRLPLVGVLIFVVLVLLALFAYTSWGAASVDEPIYRNLQDHQTTSSAPPITSAADVRVVPHDLASELMQRDYGADSSFLSTSSMDLYAHTYPDNVSGEFVWVHAPAPETAKWLIGSRVATKVLLLPNAASNDPPQTINGTLKIQPDSMFWQNRVARYAENHGEFRYVLQDVALQLDDSRHPFWIAYLARLDLRSQPHLARILIIDAYTGDEQDVAPEDAPVWLEQVYPESYVHDWAQYWGVHREGLLYRLFNANRLVEPDDETVRYIRLDNQTYWLLPMRQLSSAQLGGYVLVNTRSGNATFYDRFNQSLIDYSTAYDQLAAIMASGEATKGAGAIALTISEGYVYPIRMDDGSVRDAYVFPLLENLKVSRFAIIDAKDYNTKRVFASTMADALSAFSQLANSGAGGNASSPVQPQLLVVNDGTVDAGKAIVSLNGTVYAVTVDDLAQGQRHEGGREFDELQLAIARANRGESVTLSVLVQGGRVVDVTYPGVVWGA